MTKFLVQYSVHSSVDILVEAASEEEAKAKADPISDKVWDIIIEDVELENKIRALDGCSINFSDMELNAAFDEHEIA